MGRCRTRLHSQVRHPFPLQHAAVTHAQCPACTYEIIRLKMPGLPLSDLERCTHCGIFPVLVKGATGTVYAKGKRCLNVIAKKFSESPTSCLSRPPLRLSLISFSATSAASSAMISWKKPAVFVGNSSSFFCALSSSIDSGRGQQVSQKSIHTDTHVHCTCKTAKRTLRGKNNMHTSFFFLVTST